MKANIFTANNYCANKIQYSIFSYILITLGLLHSIHTFIKRQQVKLDNQTPF